MKTDITHLRSLLERATKGPWSDLFPECTFCGKVSDTKPNQELVLSLVNSAPALLSELEALRTQKDGAYSERDHLVCALSKMFPSHLARHPESDTSWDNDWRWIVFIELPTGQASWHIHDSEREWFNHLKVGENNWDGHDNERKYQRLTALKRLDAAVNPKRIIQREGNV